MTGKMTKPQNKPIKGLDSAANGQYLIDDDPAGGIMEI
jgi:hypothetical protein